MAQQEDNHIIVICNEIPSLVDHDLCKCDFDSEHLKNKFMNKMGKANEKNYSYNFECIGKFANVLTREFEFCYTLNVIIGKIIVGNVSLVFYDLDTKESILSIPINSQEFVRYCIEERQDGSCYLHSCSYDYSINCYDLKELMKLKRVGNPKWKVDSVGSTIDLSVKDSVLFVVHPFRDSLSILNAENGQIICTHHIDWGMDEYKVMKFCEWNSTLFHTRACEGFVEGLRFNWDFSQIIERYRINVNGTECIIFEEETRKMIISEIDTARVYSSKFELLQEAKGIGGVNMRFDRKHGHLLIGGSPSKISIYQ